MMRRAIYFLLILLVAGNNAIAQEVVPSLKADTLQMKIGEQITLTLTLTQPANLPIAWPVFTDTLGGMEIVTAAPPDTLKTDDAGILLRSQVIKVTSFDSGKVFIPPVPFSFMNTGTGKIVSVETDPLSVSVFTVPVDTTQDIRDIRGIEYLPPDYTLWYIIAAALIVVAVIAWLMYRWYKKKQLQKANEPAPVVLQPPHEVALEAMRRLAEEKIWQQGLIKLYYTRLTDILRHYLEQRWMVQAMELTSDEIMSHSFVQLLNSQNSEDLSRVLRQSDLVKFAKAEPLPSDNESMMSLAVRFVTDTAQRENLNITNPVS